MGLFNKNNNNEELLVILGEIRDNLKINNDDNIKKLETKIADAHYHNDEEIGVISSKISSLEKQVEWQDQQIKSLFENRDEIVDKINNLITAMQKQNDIIRSIAVTVYQDETEKQPKEKTLEQNVQTNENETKSYKDLFIEKYDGWTGRPYTSKGVKYDGFEFRTNGGANSNTYVCNILQLKELNDNLDEIIKDIYETNDFQTICEQVGIPLHTTNLYIKRILFTLINQEDVFTKPLTELNKQHTYQFKKRILYIDNECTNLDVDDIIYIKSCLENTANKRETIENFIDLFQSVENKYIRIISCNIEKIPSEFLEEQSMVRVENDPKGRF